MDKGFAITRGNFGIPIDGDALIDAMESSATDFFKEAVTTDNQGVQTRETSRMPAMKSFCISRPFAYLALLRLAPSLLVVDLCR
jgi:hypothetical protein